MFTKFGGKVAEEPRKNELDCGGNPWITFVWVRAVVKVRGLGVGGPLLPFEPPLQ